jgi:hypothetical protein
LHLINKKCKKYVKEKYMGEFVSDDTKGLGIEVISYGAAGFAGASLGAAVSKFDGAIQSHPELWQSFEGAPSTHYAHENNNLIAYGEVFGPLALGAVAGIVMMRKFLKPVSFIYPVKAK